MQLHTRATWSAREDRKITLLKLHRKLGWFAAGWAAPLIFFAAWELSWEATNLHTPGVSPAFLAISMGNLLCFAVLITWGFLLRKNTAAHRRIVLLANLSTAVAGFARLLEIFLQHPKSPVGNYFFFFSGTLFIVLLMLLWDWTKNRVMKQFVIGTVFVVAVQVVSIILFYNPAWKSFAGGVIEAWSKLNL